jgi:hypothetical protein
MTEKEDRYSVSRLAIQNKLNPRTIRLRANSLGIGKVINGRRYVTLDEFWKVADRVKSGCTVLAERLGISRQAMHVRLKELGIPNKKFILYTDDELSKIYEDHKRIVGE